MAGGIGTPYGRLASTYDADSEVGKPLRQQVVAKLDLAPADVVLDVGCGTGLCFSLIQARIGAEGCLIGIDADLQMLRVAEKRIEASGWDNVSLIHADAQRADIQTMATAALFCLAHDILQSASCLENILQYLVPGGRVAAGGAKWSSCWLTPVNAFVWWLNRPYVSEFAHFERPWENLANFIPSLQVISLADYLDAAYIAWGHAGHLDEDAHPLVIPEDLASNGDRATNAARSELARR